jgi:hypothetical protein
MKQLVLLLAVLLVAGCIGGATDTTKPTTPTTLTTPTTPTTPITPINPEPVTPPVTKTLPTTDDCMAPLANKATTPNSVYKDMVNCFLEKDMAYECAYIMMKSARELELEQNSLKGWPVSLYAGAYLCAEKVKDRIPSVKNKMSDGQPEPGHLTLVNYYQWFNDDSVVQGTTAAQIDALIAAMEQAYK